MKCGICGNDTQMAVNEIGPYCSGDHLKELLDRRERYEDALEIEPYFTALEYDTEDVLHLAEKFAVKTIRAYFRKNPLVHAEEAANNPFLRVSELKLFLVEGLINALPKEYVYQEKATGQLRMMYAGTFRITKPVPLPLMIRALNHVKGTLYGNA